MDCFLCCFFRFFKAAPVAQGWKMLIGVFEGGFLGLFYFKLLGRLGEESGSSFDFIEGFLVFVRVIILSFNERGKDQGLLLISSLIYRLHVFALVGFGKVDVAGALVTLFDDVAQDGGFFVAVIILIFNPLLVHYFL